MKILSMTFYFLFLVLIITSINISTAKEINVTKITTIEMNDDSSLNISTKYSTSANLLDFYSDAFIGLNNYSGGEFNYRGSLIESPSIQIKFVRVEGFDSDFKYFHIAVPNFVKGNFPQEQVVYFNFSNLTWDNLSKTSKTINLLAIKPSINSINKDADTKYIFDYELRIKSKNNSWFPSYLYLGIDDIHSQYFANDTLILKYKSYIDENEHTRIYPVIFPKRYLEVLDWYKKIKINDDGSLVETVIETLQPIFIEEEKTNILMSTDLFEFDRNLQMKEVYFILNNKKLYPTKYKNLSEMTKLISETNDTSIGYFIAESENKWYMMFGLVNIDNIGYKSFELDYVLTGFVDDKIIKDSKDVFTRDAIIPSKFKLGSPNTIYKLEVEIPDGNFIDENSINYRRLILSDPKISRSTITWQYKYSDIEPLIPFAFSYSKNEKNTAMNLLYINIAFLIVILLVFKISPADKGVIHSVVIMFVNILIQLYLGKSEFINIFLYSMAYLPILLTILLVLYNYRDCLKSYSIRTKLWFLKIFKSKATNSMVESTIPTDQSHDKTLLNPQEPQIKQKGNGESRFDKI